MGALQWLPFASLAAAAVFLVGSRSTMPDIKAAEPA